MTNCPVPTIPLPSRLVTETRAVNSASHMCSHEVLPDRYIPAARREFSRLSDPRNEVLSERHQCLPPSCFDHALFRELSR